MSLTFADPTEWWFDLPSTLQTTAWAASQRCSSAHSRWTAYLNHLCLEALWQRLQTDYAPSAPVWSLDACTEIWEVVNGSGLTIDGIRFVLIPSEAIDAAEVAVPQEWVDSPAWAGHYYLAVQVQTLPDAWVRVWGYTTHHHLKTQGHYDPDDRTYCLDAEALTHDLSTLWVTMQFCPDAQTQAVIPPLPTLTEPQAEQLIQRLSDPAILVPRLAIPFERWAALLAQPTWRRRLYQQRTHTVSPMTSLVRLGQWLQNQFETGWQSLDMVFGTEATVAVSWRSALRPQTAVTRAKEITLPPAPNPQSVALLLHLTQEADQRVAIICQVHPLEELDSVPADLRLVLQTDGAVLQSVQATGQDDFIQLRRFRCALGTEFQIQIIWQNAIITERFRV